MDTTRRDVGLRRLSRITRWSLGSAVVLTGAFSALVAHARPGHAKAAPMTTTTTPATNGDFLQPPSAGPPLARGGGRGSGIATSGAS